MKRPGAAVTTAVGRRPRGCWLPLRQLAKKKNASPDKIDLALWDFATAPGPGGRLRAQPALSASLDGDYRGSHWDKSGVLEADCLFCHSSAYDWNERVAQIRSWNLKWAATAASGLGLVRGRLFDPATGKLTGEEPKVTYHKRLFNEDGKVVAPMLKRPSDRNCPQCHGEPASADYCRPPSCLTAGGTPIDLLPIEYVPGG